MKRILAIIFTLLTGVTSFSLYNSLSGKFFVDPYEVLNFILHASGFVGAFSLETFDLQVFKKPMLLILALIIINHIYLFISGSYVSNYPLFQIALLISAILYLAQLIQQTKF